MWKRCDIYVCEKEHRHTDVSSTNAADVDGIVNAESVNIHPSRETGNARNISCTAYL